MFSRITVQLPMEGLLFWKLKGSEALSESFVLDAELLSTDARIDRQSLLGKPITFTLPTEHLLSPRYINGKITRVAVRNEELNGTRYAVYALKVEPDLWPMRRDRNLRIFQSQTVPQIVQTLLKEYSVNVESRLSSSYRVWDYCVQYQESSYDFISRLMELEGIYYWFRHEADKHTLVLCDAADQHQPFSGYETIPYHVAPSGGSVTEEGISQWSLEESVTPGMYSTDDYDFRKPNAWMLQARQNPVAPSPGSVDVYDWPGHFVDHSHGEFYTRIRQEVWEVEHHSVSGVGTATGIAPGYTFGLLNAPHFSDNGKYLTVTAEYDFEENSYASGDVTTTHNIRFTVLPASITWRTPPRTPWPKTHGPQTAKVVGPKGESIWTDRYGRVKVKFHWDRLAKGDDTSSCWVRVSSAWAGQGFGGVQIPRVGDEVVVDFINGDPDRPLIIGRVYNEASMPPWALPAAATQMGFLSRTKDGTADTANALRFEDKAGEEQLWIQAQKNMDTNVKNDATHTVANNHSHYVGVNELYRVETNRVHGVKGGEELLTGKGKIDAAVETYVLGSGTKLRLECGESAIELNANGQINIVGKGFNIFVQGDGNITTSGGKLNLNTAGAQPGTGAPGSSHKQNITEAVTNLFPAKKEGEAGVKQLAQKTNKKQLDERIIRSIMKSEGVYHVQGGRPEAYGFRKGNGHAYEDIMAARAKYGVGSNEEFVIVSKYMRRKALEAGALHFPDLGKQAAIMSMVHLRGSGGAQAILNSMQSGEIVESARLKPEAIDYLNKMSPEDFQTNLIDARNAYDDVVYGNSPTTVKGVKMTWSEAYRKGLNARYIRESKEFLKYSHE
ncbi:type VI secretion system Vgr family protein [Pantoea cypripedii]|uniref:Type VI secretion system tip protein VgrG n=1 Tax=Pantoea cypripedii TaxID=55209 RepID=A0A6B9G9S0_PANCY|nr:type VI secretion system tip protein TssI/VgrG [Pantoea cypripedii]QGY29699.1 type VI secretion system tip protein VgrG [Pantoea cypripedii]